MLIKREVLVHHRNQIELNQPITAMTINRLEEQIQMLKIKVENINARLENITSILQETHPGNVNYLEIYSQKKNKNNLFRIYYQHLMSQISMLVLLLLKMN